MTLEVTVEDVPEGPLAPEAPLPEENDSEEGPPPDPPTLQRTGSMIHPEADPADLTQKDPETLDVVEEAPLAEQSEVREARRGRKAADPEERAQRKREAQARYYLKKKAALTAAQEERTSQNKPEPVLNDIEDVPAERSTPEEPEDDPPPPPSPKKKPARKAKEPPPTEAPPEAPAQAETIPEIGPPSIRLATPQLRTRALLRRDYEQRAHKFAGLLANGLPK